jgi:uncharacterized membrane protein
MPILRNKHHDHDPVWHVEIIMVGAILLQLALPDRFVLSGHYWLLPLLEIILAILLLVATPREKIFKSATRKAVVICLIAITAASNFYALFEVARQLLQSGTIDNGRQLIIAGLNIYTTNIIVFALLYWEMDAGGPGQRRAAKAADRDFLFPQYQTTGLEQWHPTFIDYVYVASTNATAFSPTDTLPLTRRAKMLMLAQSLVALVVVALVAARAVNILG